jgi:hypothetical protein
MRRSLAVLVAAAVMVVACDVAFAPGSVAAACGRGSLGAEQLNSVFASPGIGATAGQAGLGGADYPHAYPLRDGRVLWLFQDMFFSNDDDLTDSLTSATHNAGLIQSGSCFRVIGSPGRDVLTDGRPFDPNNWFWPLDGEIGYDGMLWVFVAEMYNPNGQGATYPAQPVGTWLARIDPATLQVVSFATAPDLGTGLYGWSVASNDQYSYLYGHCYRQFVNDADSPAQFDSACMPQDTVARVPVGHFDETPQYWNGSTWSYDPAGAVSVFTRGAANPMSVQFFGDVWVSVTKADDWWGSVLYVDRAASPQGPWQTVQTIPVFNDLKCSSGCGNYGAFLMPWLDASGRMTVALSNGGDFALWYADASLYRPTFYAIDLPARAPSGSAATPASFVAAGTSAGFVPVDPVRLVDTRLPAQQFPRLTAGSMSVLDLRGSMPAGTTGVAVNLTADRSANGWVRAWACNQPEPATTNLNPVAGHIVTNASIVPVGDGRVCLRSYAASDLVVDLDGWLTTSSDVGMVSVSKRLVDTRLGQGGMRLAPGSVLQVPVVAAGSTSVAVALNVTAVDPGADGVVTAWPCGTVQPVVSNVNPEQGVNRPNLVNVRIGTGGSVCLYSYAATDLVVDLLAEYRPGAASRYIAVAPQRLLDTRADGHRFGAGNNSDLFALGTLAAAQVNLTVDRTTGPGFLTAYPCLNGALPTASNANYLAHDTVANATLLASARGYGCVYSYVVTDLVVDLFGIWT